MTHTTESMMALADAYALADWDSEIIPPTAREALQSAIAELVAERDADKKYIRELEDAVTPELVALRAERDALARDAARYRWLKDNRAYHYSMQPDSPAEHGIEYQWQQGTYEERDHGIDATIDAAMNKETP